MSVHQDPSFHANQSEGIDAKVMAVDSNTALSLSKYGSLATVPQSTQDAHFVVVMPSSQQKNVIEHQNPVPKKRSKLATFGVVISILIAIVLIVGGILMITLEKPTKAWISLFGFIPAVLSLWLCFVSKYCCKGKIGLKLFLAGITISPILICYSIIHVIFFSGYSFYPRFNWWFIAGCVIGGITLIFTFGSCLTARKRASRSVFQGRKLFIALLVLATLAFLALFICDVVSVICKYWNTRYA